MVSCERHEGYINRIRIHCPPGCTIIDMNASNWLALVIMNLSNNIVQKMWALHSRLWRTEIFHPFYTNTNEGAHRFTWRMKNMENSVQRKMRKSFSSPSSHRIALAMAHPKKHGKKIQRWGKASERTNTRWSENFANLIISKLTKQKISAREKKSLKRWCCCCCCSFLHFVRAAGIESPKKNVKRREMETIQLKKFRSFCWSIFYESLLLFIHCAFRLRLVSSLCLLACSFDW